MKKTRKLKGKKREETGYDKEYIYLCINGVSRMYGDVIVTGFLKISMITKSSKILPLKIRIIPRNFKEIQNFLRYPKKLEKMKHYLGSIGLKITLKKNKQNTGK